MVTILMRTGEKVAY